MFPLFLGDCSQKMTKCMFFNSDTRAILKSQTTHGAGGARSWNDPSNTVRFVRIPTRASHRERNQKLPVQFPTRVRPRVSSRYRPPKDAWLSDQTPHLIKARSSAASTAPRTIATFTVPTLHTLSRVSDSRGNTIGSNFQHRLLHLYPSRYCAHRLRKSGRKHSTLWRHILGSRISDLLKRGTSQNFSAGSKVR